MARFREVTTNLSEAIRIAKWVNSCGGQAAVPPLGIDFHNVMWIQTPDGKKIASVGDRIVQGADGLFRVERGGDH